MPSFKKEVLPAYFTVTIPFLLVICLVRIFEYFAIANKFFIPHVYRLELAGLVYDTWMWCMYCVLFFAPFTALYYVKKQMGLVFLHVCNHLLIIMYLALLVVFSERNTPFDHEFFTRSMYESWLTTKQMMTSGWMVYLPFVIYLSLYWLLYRTVGLAAVLPFTVLRLVVGTCLLATALFSYASPSEAWFNHATGYYLTTNKFGFWIQDSYAYFSNKDNFEQRTLSNAELAKEVSFYQANQPFKFTSTEYPLLHADSSKDVLGNFFNLQKTPPNIVILVVEGLSRDFSGQHAYAGSFTPFLDSLANHSLAWNNFLSTAPGTFAAHPAISGSLPYSKRGFSLMNVMPNHLSLIKILKANGYFTQFLIGFNPDFDNMGGYIRLQGTDFVLSKFGAKYKEMGVGSEGWSMGYPDDALFSRSFEVMDSLKKSPHLSIYHTATTHMPYLFEQKPVYEKLFDKKIKTMSVSSGIKSTLKKCKSVLTTFMFSDDCLRNFFKEYAKRPSFNNTIFFITGDHHIGSFPTTCEIDEYHVPLIVYSPMLKAPKRFLSVNSHNNLTPTITSLLFHNYPLPHKPTQVHWMGDVLDTFAGFRNQQSMPFMSWSRDIEDYIYKDYMLSYGQLYKLTPKLLLEKCKNDSVQKHMEQLLKNFKNINNYVCSNNKLYNESANTLPGTRTLLYKYTDTTLRKMYANTSDTMLIPDLEVSRKYRYLYVEVEADIDLESNEVDHHPSLSLALVDNTNHSNTYLYWTNKDLASLTKSDYVLHQWNHISTNDMFTLNDYAKVKNLVFKTLIWTDQPSMHFKMKHLNVRIYGVGSAQ